MFLLRLFHQSDPTRQVDSRSLAQGELMIGRDPPLGWRIDDPDRQISRTHCTVAVRGDGLFVRDSSANGIILGRTQERLPADQFVPLGLGESLVIGKFVIVVEQAAAEAFAERTVDPIAPVRHDTGASPFAPPPGIGDLRGLSTPREQDTFASELKRTPLDVDPFGSDPLDRAVGRRGPPSIDEDAWQRREPGRVGDWNGPTEHRTVSHETLIGSDREWSEPPSAGLPEVGFGFDAPFHRPILKAEPVPAEALIIPSDWESPPVVTPSPPIAADPIAPPPPVPPPLPPAVEPPERIEPISLPAARVAPVQTAASPAGDALFRAFCEGANLDPEEFVGEDPAAVLQRAGAIYQQMVLGLGDLLSERTSLKNEYRMARTTVAPEGNNPFKWAPARRVAVDLLRGANDGFMSGPPAVRESFEDLKKHLLCLLAGMRASIATALNALSPPAVEAHLKGQSFVIKASRAAAAWSEYARLHAEFQRQADDNPDSQINRDFRAAYEQQLGELDGLSGRR